ncbi:MAG: hypothetical protein ACYTE8_08290 [Planctomycetota bacterium]|jgi:hypothetical protein
MPDSDFNLIKPVDALGNINASTPVKRREDRKRRKNQHRQNHNIQPEIPEEFDDLQLEDEDVDTTKNSEQDKSGIDYCA